MLLKLHILNSNFIKMEPMLKSIKLSEILLIFTMFNSIIKEIQDMTLIKVCLYNQGQFFPELQLMKLLKEEYHQRRLLLVNQLLKPMLLIQELLIIQHLANGFHKLMRNKNGMLELCIGNTHLMLVAMLLKVQLDI